MKKTSLVLGALTVLAMATPVFAQSTVSGTLTAGGTANTSSTSVTGTVATSSAGLSGTVVSTSTAGGGSAGSGSGSNVIDICPNLSGVQTSLPSGYVLQDGACVIGSTTSAGGATGIPNTGAGGTASGSRATMTGSTHAAPGVPNTGAGGDAATIMTALAASALVALFGIRKLRQFA